MRTNEMNYHLDHELCEIFHITIDDLDKIELSVVEVMRELLFKDGSIYYEKEGEGE